MLLSAISKRIGLLMICVELKDSKFKNPKVSITFYDTLTSEVSLRIGFSKTFSTDSFLQLKNIASWFEWNIRCADSESFLLNSWMFHKSPENYHMTIG